MTFQRDLESATGKLACEIAVLKEQRFALDARIKSLEDEAQLQQQTASVLKTEYHAKLEEQETTFRNQLTLATGRADDIKSALEEAQATCEGLEAQMTAEKKLVTLLQEELREAKLPSSTHQEAVNTLNAQIMALRSENTDLVLRARNIDARYKTGDLVHIPIRCHAWLFDDPFWF